MLRILHMIGSLSMGGSQTMVMSILRVLDRQKIAFDFIVDDEAKGVLEDEVKRYGGRVYYLPKFNGKNVGAVCKAWDRFLGEHPEYCILHSHVRSYASLYLPIAKKHGLKTIIHSHNTSNGRGIMSVCKRILQFPLRYQADYFFGCSEWAGEWLFGKRVTKSDRYFMLKNAVDIERFAFRPETRKQIRLELGVGNNTMVLGHVGRMNVQKNHEFLLRAFREIVDRHPDTVLVLLGDGELREVVENQIHDLSLDSHVRLSGVRANVQDYMCAMDALLLPSRHEGLPVVIVEAQAAGLPCFVADTVTREVGLTDLVDFLPINQGVATWADAVLTEPLMRTDVTAALVQQGYSVQKSAQWLTEFYLKVGKITHRN